MGSVRYEIFNGRRAFGGDEAVSSENHQWDVVPLGDQRQSPKGSTSHSELMRSIPQRYPSATELLTDIDAATEQLTVRTNPEQRSIVTTAADVRVDGSHGVG